MIEGYTTIKEITEQWGITPRRVQVLCNKGKIPRAVKFAETGLFREMRKSQKMVGLLLGNIKIGEINS